MSIQAITMQLPVASSPAIAAQTAPQTAAPPAVDASTRRAAPEPPAEERKLQLEAAVRAVTEFTRPMAGNLEFSLDEQTGITVIKVTDSTTKELIRQIPSEEMLEIARALDRLQGLLVRQKV